MTSSGSRHAELDDVGDGDQGDARHHRDHADDGRTVADDVVDQQHHAEPHGRGTSPGREPAACERSHPDDGESEQHGSQSFTWLLQVIREERDPDRELDKTDEHEGCRHAGATSAIEDGAGDQRHHREHEGDAAHSVRVGRATECEEPVVCRQRENRARTEGIRQQSLDCLEQPEPRAEQRGSEVEVVAPGRAEHVRRGPHQRAQQQNRVELQRWHPIVVEREEADEHREGEGGGRHRGRTERAGPRVEAQPVARDHHRQAQEDAGQTTPRASAAGVVPADSESTEHDERDAGAGQCRAEPWFRSPIDAGPEPVQR